jgi:hypothetical protein
LCRGREKSKKENREIKKINGEGIKINSKIIWKYSNITSLVHEIEIKFIKTNTIFVENKL